MSMALSELTKPQLMAFYLIATRVWKFRGHAIQVELLKRMVREGLERLEVTGAMPYKETSYFKNLPTESDFFSNISLIQDYQEFLLSIDTYAPEFEAELQRLDAERTLREQERLAADKIARAEQAARDRLEKVVRAKQAYEDAEARRKETYKILRKDDVSMFDLSFRITANSPTDEIARLMSQLARTTVVISPGSWGSAFHTSSNCEWLVKGRNRASKFTYLGELISIEVEDAIYQYKKRPCHSCFMFWWNGEINPHPEFGADDLDAINGIDLYLGDKVIITKGIFETHEAEIVDLMRGDDSKVMIRTETLGRSVEIPISVQDFQLVGNIEELRKERALEEKRKLEDIFHARNRQIRDLEEMILSLESGLEKLTRNDLSELLIKIRQRFESMSVAESQGESLDYLASRLNRRISEAQLQVGH
jgi:hypothetical protein